MKVVPFLVATLETRRRVEEEIEEMEMAIDGLTGLKFKMILELGG